MAKDFDNIWVEYFSKIYGDTFRATLSIVFFSGFLFVKVSHIWLFQNGLYEQ